MSGFIGSAGGFSLRSRDDFSHSEWSANGDLYGPKIWDRIQADVYFLDAFFESEWWPARSNFVGGGPGERLLVEAQWWSWPYTRSGCNGRLAFTGITRDQYGSPIGDCTVKLFLTSTDEKVAEVVSNANGEYTITTPYHPNGHWISVYKTGSPDIFGTTVNTLIPG